MKADKIYTRRVLALVLVIVLVAAIVPALTASAAGYKSLSHIQSILANQTSFNILEIAPKVGTGSLGYYVDGQEPTNDWKTAVASKNSPAAREAYANGVFKALQDRGLMSGTVAATEAEKNTQIEKYPLTYTGAYTEYFPWAVPAETETELLKLQNSETTQITGEFALAGENETGAFTSNSKADFVEAGSAQYVQNVTKYIHGECPADGKTYYYYAPEFGEVAAEDYVAGMILYTYKTDDAVYEWAGVLGVDDFHAEENVQYYTVKTPQAPYKPSTAYDVKSAGYYAEADQMNPYSFAADESGNPNGYFNITITGYNYVGKGFGQYNLTNGTAQKEWTVTYNSVFVDSKSGYTNNNWFLRHVFDFSDEDMKNEAVSKIKINVNTIVPNASNADNEKKDLLTTILGNLGSDTSSYDMVVISAGFDYTTGDVPAGTSDTKYSVTNDLTPEQCEAISTALGKQVPVVLDGRLLDSSYYQKNTGDTINIQALASSLLGQGVQAPTVKASLYCYMPDDVRKALTTQNFAKKFDNGAVTTSYSDVLTGIKYENFLRKTAGSASSDMLPEEVNVANCIRYIINYSGQLIENKKTSIRILDVEPQTQLSSGSKCLNKTTVKNWVKNSGITDSGITIDTMSTAEFISKIDDINELYDLVYIGASTDNVPTTYNDSNMRGLFYSNIGDTSSGNSNLNGLGNNGNYRLSGNDITEPKAVQLKNFAASGFPVIIADGLANVTQATDEHTVTVVATATIGNNGKVQLSATLYDNGTAEQNNNRVFTWYVQGENKNIGQTKGNGKTMNAGDPVEGKVYYCKTSYKTTDDITSNTIKLTKSKVVQIEGKKAGSGAILTASTPDYTNSSITYQWYKLIDDCIESKPYWFWDVSFKYNKYIRIEGATGKTLSLGSTENGLYICGVRINNGGEQYSQTVTYTDTSDFTLTNINNATYYSDFSIDWGTPYGTGSKTFSTAEDTWKTLTVENGKELIIPGEKGNLNSISTSTVDRNSILYKTLTNVLDRDNVMAESQITNNENRDVMLKYLNLSKPDLTLSYRPDRYDDDLAKLGNGEELASLVTDSTLSYTFTISNPTDPTPASTRYTCKLYIDLNADGKFSDDEQISDLTVKDNAGKAVAENELSLGTYSVARVLPDNYSGIIPWRLMVTQNGTEGRIHASQSDYTFIKPEKATKISILQITSKKENDTSYVFKLQRYTNSVLDSKADDQLNCFEKCFKNLRKQGLYDISIDYVSVTQLNNMNPAAIKTKLNGYNMLVIGFSDMYGDEESSKGLDEDAARGVTDYIETGKAVLFSHDTTSFYNTNSGWGYYFNSIIRGAVGLDRYGVKGKDTDQSYTTAYVPKSNGTTAVQNQGYTNLTLKRYSGSGYGDNGITDTTKVSQTNSGQITTFPYKIGENIDVAKTHEQYYQLNMNSDDVVVWYCLSGSNYAKYKNDGTNAYYIYNKGNVTYTGAGHTVGDSAFSEYEAKLFVNTMVAAYRAAAVDPTLTFKTSGDTDTASQIVSVDFNGENISAVDENRVYFKISDRNLVANKDVQITFYYKNCTSISNEELSQEQKEAIIKGASPTTYGYAAVGGSTTVHSASGDPVTKLRSDTLYYVVMPDSIVNNKDAYAVKLLGLVTTTIGKAPNTATYRGVATLDMLKAGYMTLK